MTVPKAPQPSEAAASSESSPGTIVDDTATSPTSTAKKLHGRAFYESIGSPKFILAPMVDQSEFVLPGSKPFCSSANRWHRHGVS